MNCDDHSQSVPVSTVGATSVDIRETHVPSTMFRMCNVLMVLGFLLSTIGSCQQTLDEVKYPPDHDWRREPRIHDTILSSRVSNYGLNQTQDGSDFIKKESRNSETIVAYEPKGLYVQSGFGNSSGTNQINSLSADKATEGEPVPDTKHVESDDYQKLKEMYAKPGSAYRTQAESRTYTDPSIGGRPVPQLRSYDTFGPDDKYRSRTHGFNANQPIPVRAYPGIGGMEDPTTRYSAIPDTDENNEETPRQPWQVSVFSKEVTPFVRVCGGSLVTGTAVISAARCYWGVGPLPAKQFAVTARNKYEQQYRKIEKYHNYLHQADVRAIKIPPRFRGVLSNYQDDISVLLVKQSLYLHKLLRPVCISFERALENKQMADGSRGMILGLGTEKTLQTVILRNHKVPLVNIEQCMALTPEQHLKYITGDKICAGLTFVPPNASICLQDTGSGLAFSLGSDQLDGIPFLRGVASSPLLSTSCTAYNINSFTLVSAHREFLLQHIPGLEGECASWYPQLALMNEGGGDEGATDGRGNSDGGECGKFECNCNCYC